MLNYPSPGPTPIGWSMSVECSRFFNVIGTVLYYSVPCPEAQAEQNRQATVASATAAHEGLAGLALLSKSFKVNIPPKSSQNPQTGM